MKQKVLRQAARYSKAHNRIKRWHRVVAGLAAVVVFVTTYALILPAITKERETFCGYEEHTHGDDCWYTPTTVLDCPLEIHSHTEDCADADGNIVCGNANYVLHKHDENCYGANGLLACRLVEVTPHAHTESCYNAENSLVCAVAETEPHRHGEGCRDESGVLVCGKQQVLEHVHTDACFTAAEQEPMLICKKAEHSHTDDCYVDKSVDAETAEQWEATLPKQLAGVWQTDAVRVAKSQLGYYESSTNIKTDTDGTTYGYTRYGAWYGAPYGKWDAKFVAFCLYYAGVKRDYLKYTADSKQWIEYLSASGYYKKAQLYTPKEGDLMFRCIGDGDSALYRVGMVESLVTDDNGDITAVNTIEGDLKKRVEKAQYTVTDTSILGYGTLGTAYEEYKNNSPREHIFADDKVTVTATYYPAAGIPSEAQLVVKELAQDSGAEYDNCYKEAKDKLDAANGQVKTAKIQSFKLYDISFYHNGNEVQPNDKVDIKISYPAEELTDETEVTVVHYGKNGTELPKVQDYAVGGGKLNTSFATESFSLFAVITSETYINNIVTLTKHSVTSNTLLRQLGGKTFAIVSGGYALTVDDTGALSTVAVHTQTSGAVTANDKECRWLFTKYSTNIYNYEYYISTAINGTTYYLRLANGALQLTTDTSQRTRFTVGYTSDNVTIRNGSNYIRLASSGVSVGASMALSLHTLPTGNFTVNFDGTIGLPQYYDSQNHKYRLSENRQVTATNGMVTLPATMPLPGNYPMKLNGWYDIINMVYYDSSMLGKQIKVTNNTIFYPEWIAETYDIGQNVNVVKNQPDTHDFITTTVFDYNELFNTHSSTYSSTSGTWTFDPNSELGFIFFDYLTGGNIGNISEKQAAVNGVTVNVEKTNGTRGASTNFPGTITPGIANETRLNALFGDDPIPGRISLGEGDWLYSFDKDIGFYYYNSAKNAASYNQSQQRFYVYDYVVNIDSQNSLHDFLPFNYGKTTYKEKDNEANYWFGMKSEITFYLPEDSGNPLNIAADGKTDMQLRFSGDDDVWIFIDGQLALDLGGVHDVVYGEVNFATGKVKTGQALSSSQVANNTASSYAGMPGVDGTAGVTTTDLPTVLEGGREHIITIYYLERGSSLSNCSIYFNLSPSYGLELTKHDREGALLLEGAEFQVFDDEACTVPAILYEQDENGTLVEVPNAIFTTNANGVVKCYGLLLGRPYYIKETKPPPGYPNMSHYVIRVNLSERGEVTYVALDSNGGQWIYADAYIFAGDNAEGEHEHRIEIDIYNDKYIGGEKKVYAEKVWAEGSKNIPESVTVTLYANGVPMNRTLELNAANNWRGVFYALSEFDANGDPITYTVKELAVNGYGATYEEASGFDIVQGEEIPAHWEQVTYLEDGATYRFTLPEYYGWAIKGHSNSESIEPAIAADGYNDQLWRAMTANGGFYLQNVAYPDRYLAIGNEVAGVTDISGTNAIVNLTGGYLVSRANMYVQKGAKTTINGSGWGFYAVSNASQASRITAFKWVEASNGTDQEPVDGWRITNTPWPETLTIPVEKQWSPIVSDSEKQAVTVNLYLVTTGADPTVTLKGNITLSAENGWQGSFTNLPYPDTGSYYCISEATDEYLVTYSGETVTIFADNAYRDAARISIDTGGNAATVIVTNSIPILLPETGGVGTLLYTLGGALVIITGMLLLYKKRYGGWGDTNSP